jgi:hypothetical protein
MTEKKGQNNQSNPSENIPELVDLKKGINRLPENPNSKEFFQVSNLIGGITPINTLGEAKGINLVPGQGVTRPTVIPPNIPPKNNGKDNKKS